MGSDGASDASALASFVAVSGNASLAWPPMEGSAIPERARRGRAAAEAAAHAPRRHPDGAGRQDRDLQEHAVPAGERSAEGRASSCSCRSPRPIQVPLDELVGAPEVGDPRVRFKPRRRNGRIVFPLTQQSSGLQVWKVVIPPERERNLRIHEGYEWLYVLSGRDAADPRRARHHDGSRRGRRVRHEPPALVRPGGRGAGRDPERAREPRSADAGPRAHAD